MNEETTAEVVSVGVDEIQTLSVDLTDNLAAAMTQALVFQADALYPYWNGAECLRRLELTQILKTIRGAVNATHGADAGPALADVVAWMERQYPHLLDESDRVPGSGLEGTQS